MPGRLPLRLLAVVLAAGAAAACGDDGPTPPVTEGEFGQRTSAEIRGLVPFLPAAVDGSDALPFLLDTGAPVTILDATTYGHPADYQAHGDASLTAFGLTFVSVPTVTLEAFDPNACGEIDTAGVIGGDLLRFFDLTVDYLGAALFLWDDLAGPPDIGQDVAPAVTVPVRIRGGGYLDAGGTVDVPATRIVVEGEIEGYAKTFLVDTGASFVTLGETTFAALGDGDRPSIPNIPVQTLYGVQNVSIVRLASLRLGDAEVQSVPAYVLPDESLLESVSQEVHEEIAALVGGSFLRSFQTTIRYPAKRLDLARYANPVHINPNEFVSPGFAVAEGCAGGFFVVEVTEGSSAAEQGLQVGVELVAIDTQSLAGLTFDEVDRLLHSYAPGEAVDFDFRGALPFTLTLIYADLLPPYPG